MSQQEDKKWLTEALHLAQMHAKKIQHGACCGAVVVRDGKIVGRGGYSAEGGPHAEARALTHAGAKARGATMYITLEPCSWFLGKRTPSCAHAIIQSGIARVVYASADPHPRVRGKEVLQAAGVRIDQVHLPAADVVLAPFRKRIAERFQNKRPFILLKTAMSLDGKIANPDRSPLLLSSGQDADAVDALRASVDAILVGGTTLLREDPRLLIRSQRLIEQRRKRGMPEQPAKVAVVESAKLKRTSRFLTLGPGEKIIFTTFHTPTEYLGRLQQVASVYASSGARVPLAEAMRMLSAQHGIRRLMVEGGGEMNAALLALGLVDEIRVSIAPTIVGGHDTPTLVDGLGMRLPVRPKLELVKQERLGHNVVLTYTVHHR